MAGDGCCLSILALQRLVLEPNRLTVSPLPRRERLPALATLQPLIVQPKKVLKGRNSKTKTSSSN
jgi:hypothetical protein